MTTPNYKIAMCQLNLTTGDFSGNFEKASKAVNENEADIYVFPECQVTNYPSDDLYTHKAFVLEAWETVKLYAELSATSGKTLVFGAPQPVVGAKLPKNAIIVAQGGKITVIGQKSHLPNYDVFDDVRWFEPGESKVFEWMLDRDRGFIIGFCICEDIWFDDVTRKLADDGAHIIISLNSSPYAIAKANFRRGIFKQRVYETKLPLIYVNQSGGNDELVFDGCSGALDGQGRYFESRPWTESVDVVEFRFDDKGQNLLLVTEQAPVEQSPEAERYVAACMGLRDYIHKNGFSKVVLGLSGGADSALVGLMAADVIGEDNVDFILMPTNFTSGESNDYARDLAAGMGNGAKAVTVPVQPIFDVFNQSFNDAFGDTVANVAEENLQAQMRGDILSWYSNKFGNMILSTGNKSEIAVGYATLYGDMRGGFNPLKDLYKMEVFDLLEMRHRHSTDGDPEFLSLFKNAFARSAVNLDEKAAEALRLIILRPPSAELAEGQLDSDSLPDYPVLDDILWNMIDHKESLSNEEVAGITGQPLKLVAEIRRRMRVMEYKRFQSCPGPKIHRKSFTKKDWRFPMASHYRK